MLRAGKLVGMPTETVYGLAGDATDPNAVAAIYAAKGRPRINPLIVHVHTFDAALELAEFTPSAMRLAEHLWPGPLTLVLTRRPSSGIVDAAAAGLPSIALRVPAHPVALKLLRLTQRPLAAPSANLSEELSPTQAAHVIESLGERVALVLDAGPCPAGVESAIIDARTDRPTLLRPGAVSRETIEGLVGPLSSAHGSQGIVAPGMMRRHYAPRAHLRLNVLAPEPDEGYLGFSPPPSGRQAHLNLSVHGDIHEAAANLFGMLRALDARFARIAVAPVPMQGLGEAINDRLARAAAKSEQDGV